MLQIDMNERIYIYIYIYIERERERERKGDTGIDRLIEKEIEMFSNSIKLSNSFI